MRYINQMEPWIGEEEKTAVKEYLEGGWWLTEFKQTRKFEQMIADYIGSKHVSVVNNGTISLAAAIMSLDIRGEDEVIVPDYTMIGSANAVVLAGAKPVLVDIDRQNLCLDLEGVKETITRKTKAIMLVSINGRCPRMEEFVEFARDHDLFLIEDACQSLGSRYGKKHLGTFGDVGCFSFSAPKIITTGQGGALVTDDQELYQKILRIKDFGRKKSGVDYHETMGYNFKFTDLQAVIGIEQMKKLDWRVKRKKEMYKLYEDLLKNVDEVEFIDTNLDDTAPWFIDILVNRRNRDRLASYLDEKKIGTRPFYPPIHTQPPYSDVEGDFENSSHVSKRGLWLPSSTFLTDEDIKYICRNIVNFFEEEN